MKVTTVAVMALAMLTANVEAGDMVPYLQLRSDVGFAVGVNGQRVPTALAMRDAVRAPRPWYPYGGSAPGLVEHEHPAMGDGLYRLEFDPSTGRVTHIDVVKWSGSPIIKENAIAAFKVWAVRPATWKEMTVGITVRRKWVAVSHRVR
jgi:hypothetical protein